MTKTKKTILVIIAMLLHRQEYDGEFWKQPVGMCAAFLTCVILAPILALTGRDPSKELLLVVVAASYIGVPRYLIPRLLEMQYLRVIRLTERQKMYGNLMLFLLIVLCGALGLGSMRYWSGVKHTMNY